MVVSAGTSGSVCRDVAMQHGLDYRGVVIQVKKMLCIAQCWFDNFNLSPCLLLRLKSFAGAHPRISGMESAMAALQRHDEVVPRRSDRRTK
ncbi:protein of unknown function [Thauera humireducens]|jgi:hypothetical protein|nr:protein of unknown function [Thauera humireducens]